MLVRQLGSAFCFMFGLIISLSWFYWKDSPFWMLVVGFLFLSMGIVGSVFAIAKAEEDLEL